jgi:RadC-like JAB domain
MRGKILKISVLDHIILTTEGYFSFADEVLLEASPTPHRILDSDTIYAYADFFPTYFSFNIKIQSKLARCTYDGL